MDSQNIELLINSFTSTYGWMFLATALAFFFKNTVENFASGVLFLLGSDFNVDDEVYIGGTKRARIVRQSFTKTVFYLYETQRKLVIQSKQLYSLKCEKVLPSNDNLVKMMEKSKSPKE